MATVSSRTRKIVQLIAAAQNSEEYDNCVDDDLDAEPIDDSSEVEDNIETIIEERDEITGDSTDDEEMMDIDLQGEEIWFGKDETFWLKTPLARKRIRSKNVIRSAAGVHRSVPPSTSMIELFKLFISADIMRDLVTFTNQRGRFEVENRIRAGKTMVYKDVDEIEIYAYIGLLICAGALKSNREPVGMLWQDDHCFKRPIYSATMPRTRFSQITSWMRFDDKDTREQRRQYDKLAPIRNVLEMFVNNCQKYYNPGSHLTIDEQLVPFRGRCPFRVYMKSKPAKYGIKIWCLADVDTAYCKNLQVYLGKQGNTPERDQGRRVVLDLVSVLSPGHGITTDNFFTSLELVEDLLDKKMTLCGTLRKNKTCIPPEFMPTRKREIYSSIFGFQPEITMVSYVPKVNQSVILLSSEHRDSAISEGSKRKPEIITHYNATKGAVDTLDKMIAEYTCNRQSKRWPATLFMNIIDIAAVNAFVMWVHLNPEWERQYLDKRRMFLLELGKRLVQPHLQRRISDPTIKSRLTINTRQNIKNILEELGDHHNVQEPEEDANPPKADRQHPPPSVGEPPNLLPKTDQPYDRSSRPVSPYPLHLLMVQ
ncbi:piggyBac transposable element-derived protein 4-like [Photinus pyralis]|uniref:piggyBac transposable element-derived protein 4-like n=1 Tax=Photinus pyralis TaxID=7054 RepID=UPI00126724A2|nr:piggyBac transposable element-derived protein 4-like [Photinus pyralis]